MDLKNKNITVIGARKSGVGAAKLVKHFGGVPFISDSSNEESLKEFTAIIKREGIAYEIGGHSEKVFDADMIVVSPGVPSDSKIILEAKKRNTKIISEIELAYYFLQR